MQRLNLADISSIVIAIGVIIVSSLVVRREIFTSPVLFDLVKDIDDWESLTDRGHRKGPDDALVTIVEFADFQCPYCARAESEIEALMRAYPDNVALVYRHFPLTKVHPHAKQAAIAAECAGDQGHFWEMTRELYSAQDSIGIVQWSWFAERINILNMDDFVACVENERFGGRIQEDIRAAKGLGANGTPTFVVNGKMFSGDPPGGSWDDFVQTMLKEAVGVR